LNVIESHDEIWNDLNWENAIEIANRILEFFKEGEYDRIDLVYNQFKNAGSQILTVEQFLPVEPVENIDDGGMKHDYIMEPSQEVIINELIPKSLKVQFYKALLDSNAAEHGARMTAMHKATDNANDLREMGRATSSVLKGLDGLNDNIILIATTNLYKAFDKALSRRFDAIIDFGTYTKEELIEVGEAILNDMLQKFKFAGRNMRLFKKILNCLNTMPYPGELKNLIKTSIAFSDPTEEYDYLKKLYISASKNNGNMDLKHMQNSGFTVREIEILTGVSKSQVSRELME
jgi:SpoVK/Ycf46/Vps4 family AAA+-type ATPase